MVGFGPEDDHFVAELTYNYGIGDYKLGNDFMVNITLSHECLHEAEMVIIVQVRNKVGLKKKEHPAFTSTYICMHTYRHRHIHLYIIKTNKNKFKK